MSDEKVKDPADPLRCQALDGDEQCWRKVRPGARYCPRHRGGSSQKGMSDDKRLYLLTKAQDRTRLAQLSEHEAIKSLRDEVSIVRMMVEERWNAADSPADRLTAFGPLLQAFQTLERLVKSCHQLETNLGSLLKKSDVLALGQAISNIIIDELEGIDDYEEVVDRINERIVCAITEAGTESE